MNVDIQLLKRLIEKGANVNKVRDDGRTPLYMASERENKLEIIQLLLESGADPNVASSDGATSVHIAAQHNVSPALMTLLIAASQRGTDLAVEWQPFWKTVRRLVL